MLRNIISEREKDLPVSTIGKLIKISAEDKKIVSLGPGEPDFTTPKNIINYAKKKLDTGYTHYSPPGGRTQLKKLIVKKLKKENKLKVNTEQVIVTTGATEAILLTLLSTIDPGEAVLIPEPGFLAYKPTVEILNGTPISVPMYEKDGFQLSIEKLEELIIPEKTRVLILNSPGNPTGVVFDKKTLERIADFAIEHDLLIISDEAYEKLVYDDAKHISIGSLNGMENYTITLHSFSKTYAMPGFRVGYATGPIDIIKAMTKLHIFTSICAPTVSQFAAIAALKGSLSAVNSMLREYDRRRKFMFKRLNEIGLNCTNPKGAFYMFPNISEFKKPSLKFAEDLLKKAKVAVVPGTEFGKYGEGFIRLSYATSIEKIKTAMTRIEKYVKSLR